MEEPIPNTPEIPKSAPAPVHEYPVYSLPYPTGAKEMILCAAMALIALAMANFVYTGGFRLGFAITAVACLAGSVWYLASSGLKGNWYTRSLLALCFIIAAGFGYSSDITVKFVLFFFLLTGGNLALCQMAGQNRRQDGGIRSLLDAPRALFSLGCGKVSSSTKGLVNFFRTGGETSRRTGAILAGLGIALPVLLVMIPLLMSSDAAFEGLMDLLPDFDADELFVTVLLGIPLFFVFYTRNTALRHESKSAAPEVRGKGLHLFTVNTLLAVVCVLYLAYLISQIAYFSGGFLGILPDGYSTAEYARRGFFEMAWLCLINLGIITFGISLISRRQAVPLSTKLLCLFIGLVTLFLVSASCAKMALYIGTYGLTRLRVLTMAIIVFLALTTLIVSVWLFFPRLQYMKAVMLIALAIGAGVIWMDVDTQVARYNVNAYLSGQLETIDTAHLGTLGNGALESIVRLQEADDPIVAQTAENLVAYWYMEEPEDFRSWTYVDHNAWQYCVFWEEISPESEVRDQP